MVWCGNTLGSSACGGRHGCSGSDVQQQGCLLYLVLARPVNSLSSYLVLGRPVDSLSSLPGIEGTYRQSFFLTSCPADLLRVPPTQQQPAP